MFSELVQPLSYCVLSELRGRVGLGGLVTLLKELVKFLLCPKEGHRALEDEVVLFGF